jgi:hypothetical protein
MQQLLQKCRLRFHQNVKRSRRSAPSPDNASALPG